jgi:acyl-CoA synthetase (AMP-forming)/AMP-acid ligase II
LVGSRYLLAEKAIENLVEPCRDNFEADHVQIQYYDDDLVSSCLDSTPLPVSRTSSIQPTDLRELIYTSGTTGMPKATFISAGRWINTARGMALYLNLKPGDKMYTCLPLYHGAAQALCTTPTIFAGSAMSLGRKFSHRTFWPEVFASGANRLQYVGELCRYLVNAPAHPLEREHKLEEAWGNGMRPDVWEKFRQRFNIPVIHELYAATDGTGSCFNYNRNAFTRDAIALRGLLWNRWNNGNEIHARIDPDTEDIVRGADGFVTPSNVGEPGEVLHRVDPAMKEAVFRGYYKNESASDKRWMRDAFEPGDLYFRSGDVMRQDADGRVYFVDRLGDTFRWRSENVSTNEVADVIGSFSEIDECNVYGVSVPHADGRCGCAAIVLSAGVSPESLDLTGLAQYAIDRLPRYAVPLFLRTKSALSYTGTFKIQKGQAKREGIDPEVIAKVASQDRLYWLPPGARAYQPFTNEDWTSLKSGDVKL